MDGAPQLVEETEQVVLVKQRHAQTFTVSLANAYHGYLPTPEQHKLGGYETWRARSACLEVDASMKIVAGLEELFSSLQ